MKTSLPLASPVATPFLVQTQPFNSGPDRQNRIMVVDGVGLAWLTLALPQVVIGRRRTDVPWVEVGTVFVLVPVAVMALVATKPMESRP
ncbi:hypothetical protein [Catellatospora paridis]|uniref:hypothetical protein n=1 Tax=Catellatospora paridis TaxID=1617086 RepID=UPI0012D48442|nr:hypothetical protein [Catellatospora paridis]